MSGVGPPASADSHAGKGSTVWRRERRTRQHVIADLSINFVEREALLAGFTIQRLHHDYGPDLMLNTYNETGDVLPGQGFT